VVSELPDSWPGPLAALFSAAELDRLWSLTCRPGHPAAARRAARLRRLLA
jgi:hypothetical protein